MKVCPVCKLDNPDSALKCITCDTQLRLTIEQQQQAQIEKEKLTKNVLMGEDEEQALVDSWQEAMEHRLDWIWEIGDRIKRIKYMGTALTLLAVILAVLIGMSLIFSTLGL